MPFLAVNKNMNSHFVAAKYDLTSQKYLRLSDGTPHNFTGFYLVGASGTPSPPLFGPGYLVLHCCDPWTPVTESVHRLYQLNARNADPTLQKKFLCGKYGELKLKKE